ncbi:substrate-binding domain-containing protein [Bacteroidota bacterium]
MITIKEIADLAKVSTGTVDRVVHDRPGVSIKTAERIREILKKHNFKINNVASKLANRKKYTIATLMPQFDEQNSFWKSPFEGVSKAKEEVANYGVTIKSYTFNQLYPDTYLKSFETLLSEEPDALLLVPIFKEETIVVVEKLEKLEIPYLFINSDAQGFNALTFIGQNSYKSGFLAGKLLSLSLQNRTEFVDIYIRQNINNYTAISNRIKGFETFFSENSSEVIGHKLHFDNLINLSEVKRRLNQFLKENPKVMGIYVPSSQMSIIANCIDVNRFDNLVLIGHDTTEDNIKCLQDKKITFLISQKSFNQGLDAVHVMTDYLFHKIEPKKKVYSPLEIITYENYDFDTEK